MRAALVVGARPQFVKAAALLPALRAVGKTLLFHTGQHSDPALDAAQFESLGIPAPDVQLSSEGSRGVRLGDFTRELANAFVDRGIDRVVVLGDTDSTLAGALAASCCGIPLIHVEAGARSGERDLPEEINRVLVDELASLLLCSTDAHAANLAGRDGVHVVGDVMADVLLAREDEIRAQAPKSEDPYAVLTLHRAGNVDDPARVESVMRGLAGAGMPVIFPLHPRLKRRDFPKPIQPVGALPYLDFLALVAGAAFVATDSGGLQKEAYLLGVPCVTLRDATEWGETIDAGWNTLAGTDVARIAEAVSRPPRAAARAPLYGDGRAAERVADYVRAGQ